MGGAIFVDSREAGMISRLACSVLASMHYSSQHSIAVACANTLVAGGGVGNSLAI